MWTPGKRWKISRDPGPPRSPRNHRCLHRAQAPHRSTERRAALPRGAGASITAYLMDQIGAGTTVASQIASVTFTPGSNYEEDVLFSGLNLAAGTYYVVMTGNTSNNQVWWGSNTVSPVVEAPTVSDAFLGVVNVIQGNSHGVPNAYAPASTFFNDTGEINQYAQIMQVTAVPEPPCMLLFGIGLLGLLSVAGGQKMGRSNRPEAKPSGRP
jgi:hypothetical protein